MQRMIQVFLLRKPRPSQVDVGSVTLASAVYLWFPTCHPHPTTAQHRRHERSQKGQRSGWGWKNTSGRYLLIVKNFTLREGRQ